MSITDQVSAVVNKSFEEVEASSLILTLLDCYSKLYLNGGQPTTCGKCHRDYYIELKKTGMEIAKKYEEAKNRTCQPNWKDLRYIPATARHWNGELLTDSEAEYLLINDFLTEKDFVKLPSSYEGESKQVVKEVKPETIKKPVPPKGRVVKRGV